MKKWEQRKSREGGGRGKPLSSCPKGREIRSPSSLVDGVGGELHSGGKKGDWDVSGERGEAFQELLSGGLELLCTHPLIAALFASRKDGIQDLLVRYIREIELFNPTYGLVGTDNLRELVIKHIFDSIAPLGAILEKKGSDRLSKKQFLMADVGSGAGLPGIPLAICCPHWSVTLIERMERRARFLQNTIAVLGLSMVQVEQTEVERSRLGPFDIITFRAFHPLNEKLLEVLLRRLAPGGFIAAYKGRREKIEQEMAALARGVSDWEAVPVQVPFLSEERHVVFIHGKAGPH
ncbi:MAG: 16S rRNA (guanine(527)-N(7))-methyltransferase RsmG [Treponemataceae bacterium]|nr:16S rRNA (guanine(527)-N(7))-methyltransferase RsmG [Treponemataceae bacterium]